MTIQDRLRDMRLQNGYNLKTVADGIGVSLASYSYIESGARFPRVSTVAALADFYHVSVDWLLGRSEKKEV